MEKGRAAGRVLEPAARNVAEVEHVALCQQRGCELPQLTLADYQAISPAFAVDVFDMLRLEKSMSARQAIGAPSPENVAAQLARWKARL